MAVEVLELGNCKTESLLLNEINAVQYERAILHVLIVDADPNCVAGVAALVQSQGHRASKCYDLVFALKMAELLKPHLILIDASLIKQIGIEIYRELRQTIAGANAIIVATGWGLEQLALDKLDFDYRLNYPASPTVLQEILEVTASRHQ